MASAARHHDADHERLRGAAMAGDPPRPTKDRARHALRVVSQRRYPARHRAGRDRLFDEADFARRSCRARRASTRTRVIDSLRSRSISGERNASLVTQASAAAQPGAGLLPTRMAEIEAGVPGDQIGTLSLPGAILTRFPLPRRQAS